MKKSFEVSFVIPAHNESDGINDFHHRLLIPAIRNYAYSIFYVNDGSTDNTLEKLAKIAAKDKNVSVIDLSKNFGKEVAVSAGIHAAGGNITIILDADGQHPPNAIGQFIKEWQKGHQVVVGVRNKQHHEGAVKKLGSMLFYNLFNKYSGAELVPRSTDFRLITRDVREAFTEMSEHSRITRGLIDWLGFKRAYVCFDSPERIAGQPSYKTSSLVKLALNSFTSLSLRPLFFFGWVGVVLMLTSLLLGLFIIIEQFILGDPLGLNITGTAMLSVLVVFLISLILMSQAMLSVYIAHIHAESQSRPLYVINKATSVNLIEK